MSSRCCLLSPASASSGSFSHGSSSPGPLIRTADDSASMTRRKHSPGVSGTPADEMIFSINSSIAHWLM
uniref:Putative secreted protein n=1 Tax=Anopheles triannulatus TaxID=58253 RepID=A0A2M4B5D7_9DIPT